MSSPYLDPAAARTYRLLTAPSQFVPPARDLIAMLKPAAGMRILDVGTGTGVVADRMREATGPRAVIVGVDAAITMLYEGRQAFQYPVAVARLPGLPFRAATFDMAAAGFVISHVADYVAALRDIASVCRSGARIGISVWGSLPNPAARLWTDVAAQFVSRADLDAAFRGHIPWDEWFSDAARPGQALEAAGLSSVIVQTRTYRMRMPASDFLVSRDMSIQGAVLRERLTAIRRHAFSREVYAAFEAKFGSVVEYDRDVHFGVAQKK